MKSQSQKLFELLLARATSPVYLGEFASSASLPPSLPPVYAWTDRAGALHFDSDRAALSRICVVESIRTGRPLGFGAPEVDQAVARFADMAAAAAASTLSAPSHATALAELKSARQRAAARWRISV